METDDNCATMRESFSLVQNILSLTILTYFWLISRKIWPKNWCGKLCNLIWFFDKRLWRELLASLQDALLFAVLNPPSGFNVNLRNQP